MMDDGPQRLWVHSANPDLWAGAEARIDGWRVGDRRRLGLWQRCLRVPHADIYYR